MFQSLNHLLWPAICANCGESICEESTQLCRKCWTEILESSSGDYCSRCGKNASKYGIAGGCCPDCIGKEINFDGIARGGIYEKTLKDLILKFKHSRAELDLLLGKLAYSAIQGSDFYKEIDFFIPVPLHWTRCLWRGYNQSHLIARQIKHPNAKINTDLVRIRKTKQQLLTATAAKRAANVAGAFAVRQGHPFTGKKVCIIDDIKTTGATLNECARTLKAAGANKVYAVALAVAGQAQK